MAGLRSYAAIAVVAFGGAAQAQGVSDAGYPVLGPDENINLGITLNTGESVRVRPSVYRSLVSILEEGAFLGNQGADEEFSAHDIGRELARFVDIIPDVHNSFIRGDNKSGIVWDPEKGFLDNKFLVEEGVWQPGFSQEERESALMSAVLKVILSRVDEGFSPGYAGYTTPVEWLFRNHDLRIGNLYDSEIGMVTQAKLYDALGAGLGKDAYCDIGINELAAFIAREVSESIADAAVNVEGDTTLRQKFRRNADRFVNRVLCSVKDVVGSLARQINITRGMRALDASGAAAPHNHR